MRFEFTMRDAKGVVLGHIAREVKIQHTRALPRRRFVADPAAGFASCSVVTWQSKIQLLVLVLCRSTFDSAVFISVALV